ncbi:unannotated protein [freshwater metagenome]|uniref:Unannotated protein n=1 Tax=freshwater metagenome TaxID=449393 RepID=A0A6J7HFJ6_9ZZZZ
MTHGEPSPAAMATAMNQSNAKRPARADATVSTAASAAVQNRSMPTDPVSAALTEAPPTAAMTVMTPILKRSVIRADPLMPMRRRLR